MAEKKAIVIGAGIAGLATSLSLIKSGYTVTILEKNAEAIGASIRNFGMIWPIGQKDELYETAIRSRETWKQLAGKTGLSLEQRGSLHLAYHEDELDVLEEVYALFQAERPVRMYTAEETLSVSAAVNPHNLKGALFSNEECVVDPRQAISALAAYLQSTGKVEVIWNSFVVQVRAHYVQTSYGNTFEADLVFICSGSEFEVLYPAIFRDSLITKCKLQMMRMKATSQHIGPSLCGGLSLIHYNSFSVAKNLARLRKRFEQEMPEYVQNGIHVMMAQNSSGELIVGDSHEYGITPDPFDKTNLNTLILNYLNAFTALEHLPVTHTWSGTYAKMTNGSAYFLHSPEQGVYIFNGLGGNGMTLSFGLADKITRDIL